LRAQFVQGVQTGEPGADHHHIETLRVGVAHKQSR
jgi:hypothetical protein